MLESSVFLRQVSEGRLLPDHLVFVASLNSITVVPVKTLSGGGAWRERGSGEKRGKSRRSRRSEFATEYAYEVSLRVCLEKHLKHLQTTPLSFRPGHRLDYATKVHSMMEGPRSVSLCARQQRGRFHFRRPLS